MAWEIRDRLRRLVARERHPAPELTPLDAEEGRAEAMRAEARERLRAGDVRGAVGLLRDALSIPKLPGERVGDMARELADALALARDLRAAAAVWLFLGDHAAITRLQGADPRDRARAALLARDPATAAALFWEAGCDAQAAEAHAAAGRWTEARACWDRVESDPRVQGDDYLAGLVARKLGAVMVALRDTAGAGRCWQRARERLRAALAGAGDDAQRRHDAGYALAMVGADAGRYDDVRDGSLPAIETLFADGHWFYGAAAAVALAQQARWAGRDRDAATALAAARRSAEDEPPRVLAALAAREADAWERAAATARRRGDDRDEEDALVHAAQAADASGQRRRAARTYAALGERPGLDEQRTAFYRAMGGRGPLAGVDPAPPPLPEPLLHGATAGQGWRDDPLLWELDGDAVEVCGWLLLDRSLPEFVRRSALLAALEALTHPAPSSPEGRAALAQRLGAVALYAALGPLEALYEDPSPVVRAAVVRALGQLYTTRALRLLERAVEDAPEVRAEAVEVLRARSYPPAFATLRRLHERASDPAARRAALRAIAATPAALPLRYALDVAARDASVSRDVLAWVVECDARSGDRALAALRDEGGVRGALAGEALERRRDRRAGRE